MAFVWIVSLEEVIWLSSLHHGSGMEGKLDQVQVWFPSKDPKVQRGNLDRLLPKIPLGRFENPHWKNHQQLNNMVQEIFVNKRNETISTSYNVELREIQILLHPGILASSGSSTITGRTMKRWWRKNDGKKIPRKLDLQDPNDYTDVNIFDMLIMFVLYIYIWHTFFMQCFVWGFVGFECCLTTWQWQSFDEALMSGCFAIGTLWQWKRGWLKPKP